MGGIYLKVENELAAKVLGEIISEGMSISGIDLSERVRDEAICALDEIKQVFCRQNETDKLSSIEKIMDKYNIGI